MIQCNHLISITGGSDVTLTDAFLVDSMASR